jgi:HD-GYP domain-containing protein (c-di-GMP phosphodiesterase class II)
MENKKKTKDQLLNELAKMRQRISELEEVESQRKRTEEKLTLSLEKVRRTLTGTVNALAVTVEMRDPYTAGHQQRVTQLARAIAEEMGLSSEKIEGLHVAGSLHDMGKILVPAEILNKPDRLTDNEVGQVRKHPQAGHDILMGLIKGHPQAGYDILKEIDFPWPVAQIVLQHHERIDGSGYPEGLKGNEIILEARILAVADVVEAMSSHRPYRPALGTEKALNEISTNKGRLYESEIVDACLKLFQEGNFEFR